AHQAKLSAAVCEKCADAQQLQIPLAVPALGRRWRVRRQRIDGLLDLLLQHGLRSPIRNLHCPSARLAPIGPTERQLAGKGLPDCFLACRSGGLLFQGRRRNEDAPIGDTLWSGVDWCLWLPSCAARLYRPRI